MLALDYRRASAGIFAIALSVAAFASTLASAAVAPAYQNERVSAEPFGLSTVALPADGPLAGKWRAVEAAIADDMKTIAQCRADRDTCASPAALAFIKIVDGAAALSGLARVGEINRAFNLGIRAMSDQAQYGVEDRWASPLATLSSGAGDCEDYAIAKLVALREAGLPADDLRLVILRETSSGEDHAVAAARIDGRWRMLDNRLMLMIADSDITKLQPVFAVDAEGVKRFIDPAVAVAATTSQGRMPVQPQAAVDNIMEDGAVSTIIVARNDAGLESIMEPMLAM